MHELEWTKYIPILFQKTKWNRGWKGIKQEFQLFAVGSTHAHAMVHTNIYSNGVENKLEKLNLILMDFVLP